MERTIDGIDYIAKSEVLRIIDEQVKDAGMSANDDANPHDYRYGWRCRQVALEILRATLAAPEEQ